MRVLQINTFYKAGGSTGRIVYDLTQVMQSENIESYVGFGFEYSPTNNENTYKIETIPELKLSIFKTRLLGKHGFYNKKVTKKFLNWIDKLEPDIIHLHNIHNHYINIELLFEYIKKKIFQLFGHSTIVGHLQVGVLILIIQFVING